jgi:hypothetical protein
MIPNVPDNLPGADLIEKGLLDGKQGNITIGSLLVAIGATRLKALGIQIQQNFTLDDWAEMKLYHFLCDQENDWKRAYSLYNSFLRRLVSFEKALELHRAIERRKQKTEL